jgi:hypothetical protein
MRDCRYDTSAGPSNLFIDTGSYYFTIDPSTNLPSSYLSIYNKTGYPSPAHEPHLLFYDNQNRIIRDTILSDPGNPNDTVAYNYAYSGANIVCTRYSRDIFNPANLTYEWGLTFTDTMIVNNGNLIRQTVNSLLGTAWSQDYFYGVNNYTAYANPLYNPHLSQSLGVIFRNANVMDCLSRNLPADGIVNWTKDANGRVVTTLAADGTVTSYKYK